MAEAPATPLGELTALPDPLAARDLAASSPKTPPPLSALRAPGFDTSGRASPVPHSEISSDAAGFCIDQVLLCELLK